MGLGLNIQNDSIIDPSVSIFRSLVVSILDNRDGYQQFTVERGISEFAVNNCSFLDFIYTYPGKIRS